jgi:hypothetical protein
MKGRKYQVISKNYPCINAFSDGNKLLRTAHFEAPNRDSQSSNNKVKTIIKSHHFHPKLFLIIWKSI